MRLQPEGQNVKLLALSNQQACALEMSTAKQMAANWDKSKGSVPTPSFDEIEKEKTEAEAIAAAETRDAGVLRQPFKKRSRFHFVTGWIVYIIKDKSPYLSILAKSFCNPYPPHDWFHLFVVVFLCVFVPFSKISPGFIPTHRPARGFQGTDWPIFALLNSYDWTYPGIPPGNDYDPWIGSVDR